MHKALSQQKPSGILWLIFVSLSFLRHRWGPTCETASRPTRKDSMARSRWEIIRNSVRKCSGIAHHQRCPSSQNATWTARITLHLCFKWMHFICIVIEMRHVKLRMNHFIHFICSSFISCFIRIPCFVQKKSLWRSLAADKVHGWCFSITKKSKPGLDIQGQKGPAPS